MSPEQLNGPIKNELKRLEETYENETDEERRAMEIRDLGYPLTIVDKTSKDEASNDVDDVLAVFPFE